MGGCASRPRGFDLKSANSTQVPVVETEPEPEPETVSNNNGIGGGESLKENAPPPLVDLSDKPKQEPADPAPEPAHAQLPDLTSQQAERVEAIAKELEDKTEATVQTHSMSKEQGHPKADAIPSSQDKTSVAPVPLVAVQA